VKKDREPNNFSSKFDKLYYTPVLANGVLSLFALLKEKYPYAALAASGGVFFSYVGRDLQRRSRDRRRGWEQIKTDIKDQKEISEKLLMRFGEQLGDFASTNERHLAENFPEVSFPKSSLVIGEEFAYWHDNEEHEVIDDENIIFFRRRNMIMQARRDDPISLAGRVLDGQTENDIHLVFPLGLSVWQSLLERVGNQNRTPWVIHPTTINNAPATLWIVDPNLLEKEIITSLRFE
jgi:hypothetical protein